MISEFEDIEAELQNHFPSKFLQFSNYTIRYSKEREDLLREVIDEVETRIAKTEQTLASKFLLRATRSANQKKLTFSRGYLKKYQSYLDRVLKAQEREIGQRQFQEFKKQEKEFKLAKKQAYTACLLLLANNASRLKQANCNVLEFQQQLTEDYEKYSYNTAKAGEPPVFENHISYENWQEKIQSILDTTEPSQNFTLGVQQSELDPYLIKYHTEEEVKALQIIYQSGEPILQTQPNRDRHTYIIGKSGSGKTTLMLNMIYQDLKAGNGLGVIAPEQEMLTEQILPFIPENRIDDVIYFNPADENPIPFNPLNLEPDEDADLKADEVMTIFKRIIGTEGTPRIDEILRQSIYALLTTPNTTILDIPKLLDRADPDYRHQIISQLQDEYCAHFWRDTYPQFPKDAHLPVLYRIGAFTRDKRIRNTLCRTGESLNFRQVMDTGKVILFNLSDGILGEQNSQLLGQLIVSQFQLAVAGRANIPEQQRKRFYLYIDEFQTFTNTATSSYKKILSRARKYRLAIILAHQQTGQIPSELLRDIFGNVSTMVCFNVSHKDATKFSKEFLTEQDNKLAPTPPEQFVQLEVGETYCKLGRESFKMKTPLITEQPNWDIKEKIIEHSRQQFTSETLTPMATSQATPEPPTSDEPDKPLGKPKIKPTGKIK